MSWSLSIPQTKREDFEAAVDAAETFGQDASLPGVADQVAAAKTALKALGSQVKRSLIVGGASGHALQEDEGPNWHDGVSVNVTGWESE